MALNRDQLKEIVIDYLETSGFDFDIMPDHKKYDQNADGTAKLDANNQPKIIKNYGVPAMEIIIESLVDGVIDHVLSAGTLDDLSDVEITDLEINDIIKWNGNKWINTSATGGGGGVGVTDHGSLTGLSDDDHGDVYPGLAQIESITGYWTYDNRLRSNSKILFNTGIAELHGDSGTNPNLQIADTDGGAGIGIVRYSNNTSGPKIVLAKSRSSSVRGKDRVEDGDTLGEFVFAGDDGSDIQSIGAKIYSRIDGTPANDKLPSELILQTATSAGTLTDAIYINSEQDVGISVDPSDRFHVHESTSGDVFIKVTNSNTGTTSNDGSFFGIENDGIHDDLLIVNKEYTADVILRANDGGVLRFQPKPNSVASNTDRALINTNGLFVQNGGLRVSSGSTTTNPGDGNLYVEGTTTIGTIANLSNGTSVLVEDSGVVKHRTVSDSILSITDFSEAVDDRVASLLVAGTNISLTYDDAANTLTIDASGGGTTYTDEMAQDAVGTILTDSSEIDFTYDDATPSITASIIDVPLDKISGPSADHSITMADKTLTWRFTNPAGGMFYEWTGAASGHLFELQQNTGNPGPDTHMLHIEASDSDVVLIHGELPVVDSYAFMSDVTGDSDKRFAITAGGTLLWGPGNAARDTNLYRSAANTLKTDDSFVIIGDIKKDVTNSSMEIYGGTSNVNGSYISLYGIDQSSNPGDAYIVYGGATNTGNLYIRRRNSSNSETIATFSPSGNLAITGHLTIQSLTTGTSNLVLTHFGGTVQSRTIDSRVWGSSSLVDGSLTSGYIPVADGANSLANSIVQADASSITVNGNATLGNATTNEHTINGLLGIGGVPTTKVYIYEAATTGTDVELTRWQTANGGIMDVRCSDLALANPVWSIVTFNNENFKISPGGTDALTCEAGTGNVSMANSLTVNDGITLSSGGLKESVDDSVMAIYGSSAQTHGPTIEMYGRDHGSLAGNMYIRYGGYDSTGTLYVQHRRSSSYFTVLTISPGGSGEIAASFTVNSNLYLGGSTFALDNSSRSAIFSGQNSNSPYLIMYGRDHATVAGDVYFNYGGYDSTGTFYLRRLETDGSYSDIMTCGTTGDVTFNQDVTIAVGSGLDPSKKLTCDHVELTGGSIDQVEIGATNPYPGHFTSLSSTATADLNSVQTTEVYGGASTASLTLAADASSVGTSPELVIYGKDHASDAGDVALTYGGYSSTGNFILRRYNGGTTWTTMQCTTTGSTEFWYQGTKKLDIGSSVVVASDLGVGITPARLLHVYESDTTGSDRSIFLIQTASGGGIEYVCSDLAAGNPAWTLKTFANEQLRLRAGANLGQLDLETNGNVSMANQLSVDGKVTVNTIYKPSDSSLLGLYGSTALNNGSQLMLYGRDNASYPGDCYLRFGGYDATGDFYVQHRGTSSTNNAFKVASNLDTTFYGDIYKDGALRIHKDSNRVYVRSTDGLHLTLTSDTDTIDVWDDLDVAGTVEARHFQADFYIKALTADWTLDLSNTSIAGNYSMFRFSANASTYTVTITNPTEGRWYFFSNTSGTSNPVTLDFGDFTYTLPNNGNYYGLLAWYDGHQWNRTGDAY